MYPAFRVGMMENNHQRGRGFALPRAAFDAQTTPGGGMLVGSPQEVVDKIMRFHLTYGLDRVILQMGFGGVPTPSTSPRSSGSAPRSRPSCGARWRGCAVRPPDLRGRTTFPPGGASEKA